MIPVLKLLCSKIKTFPFEKPEPVVNKPKKRPAADATEPNCRPLKATRPLTTKLCKDRQEIMLPVIPIPMPYFQTKKTLTVPFQLSLLSKSPGEK